MEYTDANPPSAISTRAYKPDNFYALNSLNPYLRAKPHLLKTKHEALQHHTHNHRLQLLMFGRRKQDLTPEQYRDHYENIHIPFMRNLTGETFPLTHTRHYIQRDGAPDFLAALMGPGGNQSDFDFDAVAVLTYRDRAHFEANWAFFEDEETRRLIAADEVLFSEWVRGVFLETTSTTRGKD